MTKQVPPHPLVAAMIAARKARGLGVRVVFNDGAPDFTGYYRTEAERDCVIVKALARPDVASAEIIPAVRRGDILQVENDQQRAARLAREG